MNDDNTANESICHDEGDPLMFAEFRRYDTPQELGFVIATALTRQRAVELEARPLRGKLHDLEEESSRLYELAETLMERFAKMTGGNSDDL